ncbi:putative Zinc finger C x8 C x5 C x3 H type (and similar) [Trypanosoma vivax]|uniref:C3H1-type domain-containing protein n=1 Tax=Trypanosoma vivax (strain Y486) TaxID=1055687 RepID=G0TX71_TRYVY|nr:hypothetical protein TRVL_00639 [Trypanosoma vivax]KAH8613692.1 putative Zinc finger C x8 C x5 C x3 H type (and similar) [Trypanosoma vivax]CCC48561.1 conserved hypothetical protein [Trypanosoma vivax Y486]
MNSASAHGGNRPDDFEAFLRVAFPTHDNTFTTHVATRALAEYAGVPHMDAAQVIDMNKSLHSMHNMKTYVRRLLDQAQCDSEVSQRMTVLLPPSKDIHNSGNFAWSNAPGASPSPTKPRAQSGKKVCQQFLVSGTCTFGSRCLYHHTMPERPVAADPHQGVSTNASSLPSHSAENCVEELQQLRVSSDARWVAPNETRSRPSHINTGIDPADGALSADVSSGVNTFYPAMVPMAGVFMVPVCLPDGRLCGYSPLHYQMPQDHFTPS